MQDYEETHELNTIAPETTPSPDYPPEVRIEIYCCMENDVYNFVGLFSIWT